MKNKIIVTGGAGYVGSHVCKKLFEKGYEPITVDNLSRGNDWAVKWGELLLGDLLDVKYIEYAFKEVNPVAIIHLAAYADIGESNQKPFLYYQNNISTTVNLLNVIKKYNFDNFIFSSSCSTFGNITSSHINEDETMNPLSPYAFSKLVCEKIIKAAHYETKLSYMILRYFNAAGADINNEIGESNDKHRRIIPQIIKAIISEKTLEIYGNDYNTYDGTCVRDYVHVEDIANAHLLALEHLLKKKKSNEINIGSGSGYSILEIIKRVELILSKKVKISFLPRRNGDADCLVAQINKAQKILKWKPNQSDLNLILNTAINWEKKIK